MFKKLFGKIKKKDNSKKENNNITVMSTEDPYILIVDDLELNAELLREFTILVNYTPDRINISLSGEDCLEKVQSQKYNIIFMDIRMSGMDGYETTSRLRKSGFEGLIIGITGMASKKNIDDAIKSGMNDVYLKPLTRETLNKIFDKYHIIPGKHITSSSSHLEE